MDHNHMPPRPTDEKCPSSTTTSLPSHPPPPYAKASSSSASSTTNTSTTYSPPDISTTALPPIQSAAQHENNLPSLSSITGPDLYREPPAEQKQTTMSPPQPAAAHWPSMNPLTQFYTPSHLQQQSPAHSPGRMDVDSPGDYRRGNSVSLDDPDVRMAAEALGDLRADFVSSPQRKHTSLSSSPLTKGRSSGSVTPQTQPEPLLSLLTTAHPSIATTIEGATAAYTCGKNYSPRFKSGAEYVEGIVTPVANTVGSVGRVTGVEGGLRWVLKKAARGRRFRQSKDSEPGESHKRRKVGKDGATPAPGGSASSQPSQAHAPEHDRRISVGTIETLPAYDEVRSPEYAEVEAVASTTEPGQPPLQTRLFMSTSGLSVAMSEESLRSLKYCLGWLRWANGHITQVIENLKLSLEQYDSKTTEAAKMEEGQIARERSQIVERIATLKNDVLKTLQDAIQTVSRYAGGALPENARELVRSQLTSLPRRFFLAQKGQEADASDVKATDEQKDGGNKDKAVHDGAQRVLVLAKEGLEMMAQVSRVLDGTIVSAEEWCDKLGRKRPADEEASRAASSTTPRDVKMAPPPTPFSAPPSTEDVAMTG